MIASAFIKLEALKSIAGKLSSDLNVTVVSRWKAGDIINGASDLEVYEYCREKGWKFGISTRFHGKLFLLDNEELFLGSANLTRKGLGLIDNSNLEFGTKFRPGLEDLEKISFFLSSQVTWVNDDLYDLMFQHVKEAKDRLKIPPVEKWPAYIWQQVIPKIEGLWLKDLLSLSPQEILGKSPEDDLARDLALLNCSPADLSGECIKQGFRGTMIYAWSVDRMSDFEAVRFGALTSDIDSLLLDDPRLIRQHLKPYLEILFSWFEYLDDEFEVTERSHNGKGSRTVRLRAGNE